MKISRRISAAFLTLLLLFNSTACQLPNGLISGLISSSVGNQESSTGDHNHNSSTSTEVHLHSYSKEWSTNASYHWHDATCGHNVKQDYTAHAFSQWKVVYEATEYDEGLNRIDIFVVNKNHSIGKAKGRVYES